ncbi:hypothetical protein ACFYQA_32750 [Streptomyces sp. NPDC005774]|uniref:hypothetical protein n=1 Tax=Streptomyces sp. NPDC005774 TaxID=3364728 RepID=UPI00368C0900
MEIGTSQTHRHATSLLLDKAKPATRLVGDRLFVLDKREVPEEIQQLAENATVKAMDRARREHP